MAADRPTMGDLANEYGITLKEVYDHLAKLGFNKTNSSKQLSARQADAFRRRLRAVAARPPRPRVVSPQPLTAADVASRPDVRLETFHSTCTCCVLGFTYRAPKPLAPLFCDPCVPHSPLPGEDLTRQLARHKDHEDRLRTELARARVETGASEKEAARAFRSRQTWMVALTEVCMLHERRRDDMCKCGGGRYPCSSMKRIEDGHPRIAERIEYLLSLPPAELERKLYPESPPRNWDWEDDAERSEDLVLPDKECTDG